MAENGTELPAYALFLHVSYLGMEWLWLHLANNLNLMALKSL